MTKCNNVKQEKHAGELCMKQVEGLKETIKREKNLLREKYGVKEIGIFGSYVRREQENKSDLDVLVDYEESPSLFELVDLQNYLSELLGVKVDVVMKSALKQRIGARILKEVVLV